MVIIQGTVLKYHSSAGTKKKSGIILHNQEERKKKERRKTPSLKQKRGISRLNRTGFWMQRNRPKDAAESRPLLYIKTPHEGEGENGNKTE